MTSAAVCPSAWESGHGPPGREDRLPGRAHRFRQMESRFHCQRLLVGQGADQGFQTAEILLPVPGRTEEHTGVVRQIFRLHTGGGTGGVKFRPGTAQRRIDQREPGGQRFPLGKQEALSGCQLAQLSIRRTV